MNCRKVVLGTWLFVLSLSLGAAVLCAQEEPPPAPDAPPKPAGYSFPGIGTGQQEGELQPDFSPLTGMQNPTLGLPEIRHSYWVPGIQFSSNEYSNSGGSGWTSDNYFIGNLSLVQAWNRALFAVNYSGGGYVSSNSQQGGGYYQQLALAQSYQSERWLIQFVDQFSHLPQSAFGFGGGTNLGIPGVGGSLGSTIPGLGGNYTPNQTIYGIGPFTSNVSALQATYALSRRSSVTVAGSYGLLRFEQGNYDSNTTVASAGYNYQLTRNDTVGLVYRYSSYQYPGNPQAYSDNTVSIAYGRKVTGRLGLAVFAGPEITNFRIPVGNTSQNIGLSAAANMTYAFERGVFTVGYLHGLSAGSGVLIGSNLDSVTATVSRQLTRQWTGSLNFGYSRNSPVVASSTAGPAYSDWFVGCSAGRPIGRDFNFAVAYTANIGSYSGAGCTGAGCSTSNNYSTITLNFQWHPRPFVLR